ncbi:Hypothetical predicted protein [Pelobates cultripes]|uniref:Synaptonemal complex central element protein 2 n=1 Tax=Pelobates cultripes TaxID=61616 RepID=A0AAD1WAA3_PELCU|nr:Hypothetical predicted protein [Pelobates cultripes]
MDVKQQAFYLHFDQKLKNTTATYCPSIAPSKQIKLTDPIRQFKKEHQKTFQDGDDKQAPSPASEILPDPDIPSSRYSDEPVMERRLHSMLQDLRHTLQQDFKALMADKRKDINNIGDRTHQLEQWMEELCSAHNKVVETIQSLVAEQKLFKHKMVNMEDRARWNNVRFRGISDKVSWRTPPGGHAE